MDKQGIKNIIEKYQNSEASPEERAMLLEWYNNYATTKPRLDFPQDIWIRQISTLESILELPVSETNKTNTTRKLHLFNSKSKWIYTGIATAASIIMILGAGLYFYNHFNHTTADIPPGRNTATLTLANGKKIRLTDALNGEFANQAGVTISKTKSGQIIYEIESQATNDDKRNPALRGSAGEQPIYPAYNTLTTAKGETYGLKLSDGTVITLNAATSIRFAASFNHLDRRSIELSGEAYFQVTHNAKKPFTVRTNGQLVEDLGTAFNINAYNDDNIQKTTLVEGSAKVSSLRGSIPKQSAFRKDVILKPGQQTILVNNKLTVTEVDVSEAIAWKNNLFKFNEERLEDILANVARWYDVSFTFENSVLKDQQFSGSISKLSTVSKVLEKLEIAGSVHFERKERRIIVKN